MKVSKKIIIAGGSGFLGQRLKRFLLAQACEVVVLTRKPGKTAEPHYREVPWSGESHGLWAKELDGADVLINLTGQSVNCRFNPTNQKSILDSRLNPIQQLGQALQNTSNPPALWIQAAGISIYGDAGDLVCDEHSRTRQTQGRDLPHETFLPEVCQQWETGFEAVPLPHTRKVILRISSVLDPEAGALGLLGPMTRWGLGGGCLPGTQYMSWIHIEDWIRCVMWLTDHPEASGTYNVTAPQPVTNRAFMQTLRTTLHRPWSPPVPQWAMRCGCLLMQTEPVLVLASVRAVPKRLQDESFTFQFPELPEALHQLYPPKGTTT